MKESQIKTLHLVASLITIINFGLSFLDLPSDESTSNFQIIQFPLNIGFFVFIILEGLFGYIFEQVFLGLKRITHPVLGPLAIFVLILISAWTSLFNINWLVWPAVKGFNSSWFFYLGFALFSNVLMASFIYYANRNKISIPRGNARPTLPLTSISLRLEFLVIFLIHSFCMLLLFFLA